MVRIYSPVKEAEIDIKQKLCGVHNDYVDTENGFKSICNMFY